MSLPGRWRWRDRPIFCELSIRETALATLIHQRRLTPSCGGQAPTAERTVGPARMIAESLTPKPGIREQYRHKAGLAAALSHVCFLGLSGLKCELMGPPLLTPERSCILLAR